MRAMRILLAAVAFGILAAPAAAQDTLVERLPGRVYAVWERDAQATRFVELKAYNLVPGTYVGVGCEGRSCPRRLPSGEGVESAGRAGADGYVDATRMVRGVRLRAGTVIDVQLTAFSAAGLSDIKKVTYKIRARRDPELERVCYRADESLGTVGLDCAVSCPPGSTAAYCQGLERIDARWAARWASTRRSWRVRSLTADPTVADTVAHVFCRPFAGCPFGLRVVHITTSGQSLARTLRGLTLRRDQSIAIHFVKQNHVGDVVTFRLSGGRVVARSQCIAPTRREPHACA